MVQDQKYVTHTLSPSLGNLGKPFKHPVEEVVSAVYRPQPLHRQLSPLGAENRGGHPEPPAEGVLLHPQGLRRAVPPPGVDMPPRVSSGDGAKGVI